MRQYVLFILLVTLFLFRGYKICLVNSCNEADYVSATMVIQHNLNLTSINKIRDDARELSLKLLPSPHSELLLGITIGLDELDKVPVFSKALRSTGTIHVVVVSGYNISLVFNFIFVVVGKPYKPLNLFLGISSTLFFALLSGFQPPVIRAWLMGIVSVICKYYGKGISIIYILFVTALVMLIVDPYLISSLSFQLSFMATLSLVLYSDPIKGLLEKTKLKGTPFLVDLSASLGAQVLVWPLISYHFGSMSLLSPIINGLILWTIPLSTILGSLLIMLNYVSPIISYYFSLLVYIPIDIFIQFINISSHMPYVSMFYTMPLVLLIAYYFLVLFFSKPYFSNAN